MDDYREVGGVNTLREEGRIKELKSTLSFKSKIDPWCEELVKG